MIITFLGTIELHHVMYKWDGWLSIKAVLVDNTYRETLTVISSCLHDWSGPISIHRMPRIYNTLRLRQNSCHFPDDILKCIFLNENLWISTKISLKFVLKGPISSIPALVQIMAWPRPVDKLLSEPMMVSLLTHICVTRPQWVNESITDIAMGHFRR